MASSDAGGGSWRQMAADGGRSDPAAFLLSETRKVALLHQEKRKNWRKFQERSQGVYGVCCEKIDLSIYDHYQRVVAKIAISELHFLRG